VTLAARALTVWAALMVAEVVHGIARTLWLAPRVGDFRARQIGVFTGSAIIVGITWACIRWLAPPRPRGAAFIGGLWLALTLAFEVAFGRFVVGASWARIASDYDLRHGGLLPIGLLVLTAAPLAAARARGLFRRRTPARPGRPLDRDAWSIEGISDPARFFSAVADLLPEATLVYMEGSPGSDIEALLERHAADGDYRAPAGTLWSWPGPNQRRALRASPALFTALRDAAASHAAPEICAHLHLYRGDEPLAQWFDAFADPLLVSRALGRATVARLAHAAGGTLRDAEEP
jgi:hypothetical protein